MYWRIFAAGIALTTLLLAAPPSWAGGLWAVLGWDPPEWNPAPPPNLPGTGFVVQSCETDLKMSPCEMRDEVGGLLPVSQVHYNAPLPTQVGVSKCYQVLAVLQGVRSVPTSRLCFSR